MECPSCNSEGPFYRDGLRQLSNGESAQRWLCRECGYRFSQGDNNSKTNGAIGKGSQICVLKKAKNLDTTTETKTVAGDLNQTQQGLILEFQWKMKKRQLADITIESRTYLLNNLVRLGANLNNPDSVETVARFNFYLFYQSEGRQQVQLLPLQ
jgi:transposase-like protein